MNTSLQKSLNSILEQGTPRVSVIITAYNKAQYLSETVQSVVSQRYRAIDIVIVNDGSTDNTEAVAEGLARNSGAVPIVVVNKKNGGVSDARNSGVTQAPSRLVLCLDGDDLLEATFVEKAVAAMRTHGANLVYSDMKVFGAKSEVWQPREYDRYFIRYDNCITATALFDRELWRAADGYPTAFPFHEDWSFYIACSRHGLKPFKIPELLIHYRATESGLAAGYFVEDKALNVALMMTNHHDLYTVDEVLWSHRNIAAMPERWFQRFAEQARRYPQAWILKFWQALYHEGRSEIQEAQRLYAECVDAAGEPGMWQPLYRIGLICENTGKIDAAANLFHHVRTLRPDMNRHVLQVVERFEGLSGRSMPGRAEREQGK